MSLNDQQLNSSPRWSSTVKLVVALAITAIAVALFIRFRNIVGPLMLIGIISYLLHPLALKITNLLKWKWSLVVSLMFFIILLVLMGLLTWGGFALVTQIQTLITFLEKTITTLPETISEFYQQDITIGTFTIDLAQYDISQLINPLFSSVEPILKSMGTLVASLASGAAEVVGWLAFIILVSYFVLLESKGLSNGLFNIEIPGFASDIRRMGNELGKIWNGFLRGQILIILLTIVIYTILLSILGIRFAFGLALLAGLARFVPYIGPAVAWTTLGLVTFFQASNYFGFSPLLYALVCVGVAWLTDVILDNLVATPLLAQTLKIHPAAVLVMAIIGANLFGFVGVILASPVVASLKLFWMYVLRKFFDMDPWEGLHPDQTTTNNHEIVEKVITFFKHLFGRVKRAFKRK